MFEQSLVILVTSSSSYGCSYSLCLVGVPFGQCLTVSFVLYCSGVCEIVHGPLFFVLVDLLEIDYFFFWIVFAKSSLLSLSDSKLYFRIASS